MKTPNNFDFNYQKLGNCYDSQDDYNYNNRNGIYYPKYMQSDWFASTYNMFQRYRQNEYITYKFNNNKLRSGFGPYNNRESIFPTNYAKPYNTDCCFCEDPKNPTYSAPCQLYDDAYKFL